MYLSRNEPGNALKESQEALSIFCKLGDKRGKAQACELIAEAQFWLVPIGMGNSAEAISKAREAAAIFHDLRDNLAEAAALHTLANAQLLGKASADAMKSARLSETLF